MEAQRKLQGSLGLNVKRNPIPLYLMVKRVSRARLASKRRSTLEWVGSPDCVATFDLVQADFLAVTVQACALSQ